MDRDLIKPIAWMRKWAFDKNEGTKGNRPKGWKFQPISEMKLFGDDIPLYFKGDPNG